VAGKKQFVIASAFWDYDLCCTLSNTNKQVPNQAASAKKGNAQKIATQGQNNFLFLLRESLLFSQKKIHTDE